MSKQMPATPRITVPEIRSRKGRVKVSMVTCYDAAFGRLVETSQIDMVLVGDSLGNVMLGHPDTIPVTMQDMIHHCRAVTRVVHRPLVIADMPFGSYQVSKEDALRNAIDLFQQGRVQAVKMEGGREICEQVRHLTANGVPVMGHLGLTPQHIHSIGGYKVQGKGAEAQRLLDDAAALEQAGAFAMVLELVPAILAEKLTANTRLPTIGIGAGMNCDGQVLVLHDLLGFDAEFQPKFLKKYANLSAVVSEALGQYHDEVTKGKFPSNDQSY